MTNLHLYINEIFDFKAQTIIKIHVQHTIFTQNNKNPPTTLNRRKNFPTPNPKVTSSQYRTKGQITKISTPGPFTTIMIQILHYHSTS